MDGGYFFEVGLCLPEKQQFNPNQYIKNANCDGS